MLRVALTGGIATGKSYCLAAFAALGVPIIDADALARDAVAPGSPGLRAVGARFGAGVLRADGTLDRGALARIVFSDPRARATLEAIIHPEVYRRIQEWYANLRVSAPFAMADIPLVFETGHNHEFDRVVVAACDPDVQLRRVVVRDGLSEPEARARIAAQWPIADKVARADRVIWTDRSFTETDRQVKDTYEALNAIERDHKP